MRELPEGHGEQFGPRVAEHVAEAIVDPEKVSIKTGVGDADSRLLERGPEPLFALAERGFGILQLRDVAGHRDQADHLPVLHPQRGLGGPEHPRSRARCVEGLLKSFHAAGFDNPPVVRHDRGGLLRVVVPFRIGVADHLLGGLADHGENRGVGEQEPAVGVLRVDRIRRTVANGAEQAVARLRASSARLRSEMSWTIVMDRSGLSRVSLSRDTVTLAQTCPPSLRRYRFSRVIVSISPLSSPARCARSVSRSPGCVKSWKLWPSSSSRL